MIKNPLKNKFKILPLQPNVPVISPLNKIDSSLTPNMRALRLVMSISERLLSMGVAASDVVHMCLGITDTYCERRVHLDISYTQIMISQDRGLDREPLTLIRTIVPEDANYRQIQALQSLALNIPKQQIPLEETEKRIDKILAHPKKYPRWVLGISGGMVSAGVVLLYDGSALMIGMSFVMGFLVTYLLGWLEKIGISTFFSQATTSLLITLMATGLVWANTYFDLSINPTILVIGGIVLLVAGMMIVGAFQDAIDEYYITAGARLLKVVMATGGIVVGVMGGLFVAGKLGITFPATPDRLGLADTKLQYLGALIIAAFFALRNHIGLWGMIVAGVTGAFGWWLSRLGLSLDLGIVLSSAMAATAVGLLATLVSRIWRIPSLAIIAVGIVPLVPGLSLYNGLMGISNFPPGDPSFMFALATLTQAVMIGFGVAAGAALGNMIGRPIRRRVIRLYNRLPRRKLSHS